MKKFFFSLFVSVLVAPVFAEGYQVNVLSAKQTGMGHVGAGMKLGAESMHFNPAGLVFLNHAVDLSVGVSGVMAKAKYTCGDYTAKTDNPVSTPMYAYAGFKIYDNFAVGISLTTPYGSSLKWPKDWKGAHLIQDISLKSFVLQPTFSYKITDKLSIGAGLMLAVGNVNLSRALMSAGGFQVLGSVIEANDKLPAETKAQLVGVIRNNKGIVPAYATLDGDANVRAGFNVGVMYDVCDKWTLGVSYRSKIAMKVKEGKAELDYANPAIQQLFGLLSQMGVTTAPKMDQGTFRSGLPLPSNTTLGVSYRPNDRWELALDLQYVGWSAYDSLNVVFNEAVLKIEDIKAEKNYKNTMIYRMGAKYVATERLDVRAGVYVDQSPIRGNLYNPETPGMTKLGLSTGLSFEPYKNLQVDFAFLYIQGLGKDGSYPDVYSPDGQFSGRYESNAYTVSLGLAYKF